MKLRESRIKEIIAEEIEGIKEENKIIPYYRAEGKKYLTVAFGCTGGIHRSVFVTEKVFKEINKNNIHVFLDHRDIKR